MMKRRREGWVKSEGQERPARETEGEHGELKEARRDRPKKRERQRNEEMPLQRDARYMNEKAKNEGV